jgi:hypothetical protein
MNLVCCHALVWNSKIGNEAKEKRGFAKEVLLKGVSEPERVVPLLFNAECAEPCEVLRVFEDARLVCHAAIQAKTGLTKYKGKGAD